MRSGRKKAGRFAPFLPSHLSLSARLPRFSLLLSPYSFILEQEPLLPLI